MMEQLKPCPFCGGKASLVEHTFHLIPGSYGVKCEVCKSQSDQFFPDAENAIKAWNRRAEVAHMEYDREEFHENCTVHVLWNSKTGEQSIGWWKSDKPPKVIGGTEDAASI